MVSGAPVPDPAKRFCSDPVRSVFSIMRARTLFFAAVGLLAGSLLLGYRPVKPATAPPGSDVTVAPNFSLPRHPAPVVRRVAHLPDDAADDLRPTNLLVRMLRHEEPARLVREQLEAYLRDNHRTPDSLLGAFDATRDDALLQEAEQKFPNDPRVELVAATQSSSPEDRRRWLDALKETVPNNALANYLSAADYFKSGQTDLALQDVEAGVHKPMQDYQLDSLQNAAEAYRAVGYLEADASAMASIELLLPDLGAVKNVGYSLVDLARSYQRAGDTPSAQAALQLAMDLAQRVNVPGALTLAQNMVGCAIQQQALGAMDPHAVFGSDNQTVQSQLDAANQQRESIKALNKQWATLVPLMSDQDVASFYQRERSFGEQVAEQWVVTKYAAAVGSQP